MTCGKRCNVSSCKGDATTGRPQAPYSRILDGKRVGGGNWFDAKWQDADVARPQEAGNRGWWNRAQPLHSRMFGRTKTFALLFNRTGDNGYDSAVLAPDCVHNVQQKSDTGVWSVGPDVADDPCLVGTSKFATCRGSLHPGRRLRR